MRTTLKQRQIPPYSKSNPLAHVPTSDYKGYQITKMMLGGISGFLGLPGPWGGRRCLARATSPLSNVQAQENTKQHVRDGESFAEGHEGLVTGGSQAGNLVTKSHVPKNKAGTW